MTVGGSGIGAPLYDAAIAAAAPAAAAAAARLISWLCIVVVVNRDTRDLSFIVGSAFGAMRVQQLVETSERHAAQHLQLRLDGFRGAAAPLLARHRAVLARFLELCGVLQGEVGRASAH